MRLLHTIRRELKEVPDRLLDAQPYCILSHRWNSPEDEILYSDIEPERRRKNWKKHTPGYRKLDGACVLAARLGYRWIWIDTCCIDKSSSAELSETLNSMFRWYADAALCIAYLADVGVTTSFEKSVWWTRGWTLQELIAPDHLRFYDGSFFELGDKRALSKIVSQITGISQRYLLDNQAFKKASVATRFSWASKRKLGRKEDEAYCLLGLMQVNMSANYGEKEGAFLRLQREIMQNSDDESLFAWIDKDENADSKKVFGLLAPSPRYFASSRDVKYVKIPPDIRTPYRWTQKGVEIKRRRGPREPTSQSDELSKIAIGCTAPDHKGVQRPLFVVLCRVEGQHYRTDAHKFQYYKTMKSSAVQRLVGAELLEEEYETFYVAQHPSDDISSSEIKTAAKRHKREIYVREGISAFSNIATIYMHLWPKRPGHIFRS